MTSGSDGKKASRKGPDEGDPYAALGVRPDEELLNNPLVPSWKPFWRKGKAPR